MSVRSALLALLLLAPARVHAQSIEPTILPTQSVRALDARVDVATLVPVRMRVVLSGPAGDSICDAPCRIDVTPGATRIASLGLVRYPFRTAWLDVPPGASRIVIHPFEPQRFGIGVGLGALALTTAAVDGLLYLGGYGRPSGGFLDFAPMGHVIALTSAALLLVPATVLMVLGRPWASVLPFRDNAPPGTIDYELQRRAERYRQERAAETLRSSGWYGTRATIFAGVAFAATWSAVGPAGEVALGSTGIAGFAGAVGVRRGVHSRIEIEGRAVVKTQSVVVSVLGRCNAPSNPFTAANVAIDAMVRVRPAAMLGWTFGVGPSLGVWSTGPQDLNVSCMDFRSGQFVPATRHVPFGPLAVGGVIDTSVAFGPREIIRIGARGAMMHTLLWESSASVQFEGQFWAGVAIP